MYVLSSKEKMLTNWKEKFENAFMTEPIPKSVVIPKRSGYIEDFENIECDEFFLKRKWIQLDRRILAQKGQFFPGYMIPKAFAYYLPAMFLASIENENSDLGNALETIFSQPCSWLYEVIRELSPEQRSLIRDALHTMMEVRHGEYLEYFIDDLERIDAVLR